MAPYLSSRKIMSRGEHWQKKPPLIFTCWEGGGASRGCQFISMGKKEVGLPVSYSSFQRVQKTFVIISYSYSTCPKKNKQKKKPLKILWCIFKWWVLAMHFYAEVGNIKHANTWFINNQKLLSRPKCLELQDNPRQSPSLLNWWECYKTSWQNHIK